MAFPDGSGSGLDADTLDGTHKTGLLTSVTSSSTTNLSVAVGGTTKSVADLYATYLDGVTLAGLRGLGYAMQMTTIDASSLDEDTWYPVTINLGSRDQVLIALIVSLDSGTKPSWSTHNNGFSVRKVWYSNGSGWGVNQINRVVLFSDYSFANTDPVRGIGQMSYSSNEYVYVRGGGKYLLYTSHAKTVITLHTSTYTVNGQSVSPTTTAPAAIVRNNAYTSDNVYSATQLQTARTIWGQSFDGTANVSGNMTGVGSITMSGALSCATTITTNGAIRSTGGYMYLTKGWFQNDTPGNGLYNLAENARWFASGGNWITDKSIRPYSNNAYALGTSSVRWNYVYTTNTNTNGLTVNGQSTFAGKATFNDGILSDYTGSTWISMATRSNVIAGNGNNSETSAHALYRVKDSGGNAICFGGLGAYIGFYGFTASRISSGTNGTDWRTVWNVSTGALTQDGALTVSDLITANGGLTTSQYIQIGSGRIKWDSSNNALYVEKSDGTAIGFYSKGWVSAKGANDDSGTGGGGSSYSRLDSWDDYDSSKSGWVLSALLGNDLNTRVESLEAGSALSLTATGSGNVVTAVSKSGTTLTVTKGITAALSTGTNATGTWPISITGISATATKLALQDTRSVNTAPFTGGIGLHYHFKYNTADGLNDGGTYHSVLQFNQWNEQSGGLCKQLALTDGGNMWFRTASSATAWGAWNRFLQLHQLHRHQDGRRGKRDVGYQYYWKCSDSNKR